MPIAASLIASNSVKCGWSTMGILERQCWKTPLCQSPRAGWQGMHGSCVTVPVTETLAKFIKNSASFCQCHGFGSTTTRGAPRTRWSGEHIKTGHIGHFASFLNHLSQLGCSICFLRVFMSIWGCCGHDFDLKNDARENLLFSCYSSNSRASLRKNHLCAFTNMCEEKVVEVYYRRWIVNAHK